MNYAETVKKNTGNEDFTYDCRKLDDDGGNAVFAAIRYGNGK